MTAGVAESAACRRDQVTLRRNKGISASTRGGRAPALTELRQHRRAAGTIQIGARWDERVVASVIKVNAAGPC